VAELYILINFGTGKETLTTNRKMWHIFFTTSMSSSFINCYGLYYSYSYLGRKRTLPFDTYLGKTSIGPQPL